MGTKTAIEWTHVPGYTGGTWNPWQGCKKKSAGCKNCYMYREKKRYGQDPATVVRSKDATFNRPLKVKEPTAWFTCSWSDFFNHEADDWRMDAWRIIEQTPHHLYLILTKLPERIRGALPVQWLMQGIPENIWWGISAEDQENYIERWQALGELFMVDNSIKTFVSVEPMLGLIDIDYFEYYPDWIIIGGESGSNARPFDIGEAIGLVEICKAREVKAFVKQIGDNPVTWSKVPYSPKAGTSNIAPKGGDTSQWPLDLFIREFPT